MYGVLYLITGELFPLVNGEETKIFLSYVTNYCNQIAGLVKVDRSRA
jgi:hypothetical protein